MGGLKNQKNNIGGTIGLVIGLVSAAAPIAITILDKIPVNREPKFPTDFAIVPELYTEGFPLTLEQAKERLTSEGLGILPSKLAVKDAKIKYKDCFDWQVVDSQPKSRVKVKSGTMVVVRYITRDVIDESKKIFEENEIRKTEQKTLRTMNRAKQKIKIQQGLTAAKNRVIIGLKNDSTHELSLDNSDLKNSKER